MKGPSTMNYFPKGTWRYAGLLLVLLVLAALAAYSTLSFLTFHASSQTTPGMLGTVKLMVYSLTTGFLFLSGALGLWGIRYAADAESRRRIGLLVSGMDYVTDGVVAMDDKGRVIGTNLAARLLGACEKPAGKPMEHLFPVLSSGEVELLEDASRPRELEKMVLAGKSQRILRFRSEPSGGVTQVLVSDITDQKADQRRAQQAAHLQLVGRLARGVANDFNTVLCAISGHAQLLRGQPLGVQSNAWLEALLAESERGARLARQLVDLSRVGRRGATCDDLAVHVRYASEMLSSALDANWRIEVDAEDELPRVPYDGRQVEHLVLNLGLMVSDTVAEPGRVRVSLARGPKPYAARLLVEVAPADEREPQPVTLRQESDPEGGVILSVLLAMVEEIGGRLVSHVGQAGRIAYEALLPHDAVVSVSPEVLGAPGVVESPYYGTWSVLIASPAWDGVPPLEQRLRSLGMDVEHCDDLVAVLESAEQREGAFAAILLDEEVLENEVDGLLHALRKLQPETGMVVRAASDRATPLDTTLGVVSLDSGAGTEEALNALIRAREKALRPGEAAAAA